MNSPPARPNRALGQRFGSCAFRRFNRFMLMALAVDVWVEPFRSEAFCWARRSVLREKGGEFGFDSFF